MPSSRRSFPPPSRSRRSACSSRPRPSSPAGAPTPGAAQLACGRADARRGHVALSPVGWSFALLALAALTLWRGWVLGVTPADVGGARHPLVAAPRGHALFFVGDVGRGRAGFSPAFLMDAASGAYTRVSAARMGRPAFAGDGTAAVWVAPARPWWWYVAPFSPEAALDAGDAEDGAGSRGTPSLAVARLGPGAPAIEERR